MGDLWKWASRALVARAAWHWWRDRHIRAENAAYFLDSKSERELLSGSNKGLVLDGVDARLSADDSFRNLAVIATTGAGKTSSFILPNLLTLDDCSIVTTDPSGTLYERTSGDLKKRGYDVVRLDPVKR